MLESICLTLTCFLAVDNEHLNKKKSKKCCIYKKPKRFDESDTESSEGSHDEDDCRHGGH